MIISRINFDDDKVYKELISESTNDNVLPAVTLNDDTLSVDLHQIDKTIYSIRFTSEETAEIFRLLSYMYAVKKENNGE